LTLKIFLLGQFRLQADNIKFELPSRPAQSLLAYLALNAGVTQRREKLAGLLWPEAPEANARSYLRQALWRIRKSLEGASLNPEDYLKLSEIEVFFDQTADYSLDADQVLKKTDAQSTDQLIHSLSLYRGELLPGFYEEWVIAERDRLQAAYLQKMNQLLEMLLSDARWDEALHWSEQWIRLGYSPEPAFRALMRAHAGLGDQTMISATYQRCVESLDRELGVPPSPETRLLYEQLLSREANQPASRTITQADFEHRQPAFLEKEQTRPVERQVFVARQPELARLEQVLNRALSGQGGVLFVTGEAGSGKTALIQEFTHNAQRTYADLIFANGSCNAQIGIGDPYLPLREILGMLTGDVEARWAAGAITSEHARRLWNMLPFTARAVASIGPDLIDTFVLGSSLLERSRAYAPGGADWLTRLESLIQRAEKDVRQRLDQSDLLDQYSKVMQTLAREAPLVLVLDDLQWADRGSISLLFHLVRRLTGKRILIIGAFRPEEVAVGIDGARHPLETVVNELLREFGDIIIDVDQAERHDFVESLLDSEPNQLGLPFREMLYKQTRGHALFTIELLRGLQERGDLVKDTNGEWRQGASLDWEKLPVRVEAAIAERIDRLPESLQAVLRAASIESGDFIAEVLARILRVDERALVQHLSGELDRKHRLVRAQAIERLGTRPISRYRFRHYLFQKYLYDHLDEVERAYLHEDLGNALEGLFTDQSGDLTTIAPNLAHHFQKAGIADKAIHYLHLAGVRAVQLSAFQEANAHLTKGLGLLVTQPDSQERAQQELAFQLKLGIAWGGTKGMGDPELIRLYDRARKLCQQIGDIRQLCQVLGEMALCNFVGARHMKARELAEEALGLAAGIADPLLVALCRWYLGVILFFLGEYASARTSLGEVIAFYDPEQHHHPFVFLRGSDFGLSALAYDACCLWCLGYPDQATQRSQQALSLAGELDHPFSLADVVCYGGCMLSEMRQDYDDLLVKAEKLDRLGRERVEAWQGTGTMYRGMALVMLGQVQEGVAQMLKGATVTLSRGVRVDQIRTLYYLGWAKALENDVDEGLFKIDELFGLVEQTGERHYEADYHRLQGEMLLIQGNETAAEASYLKAIDIARRQSARSWELRATLSLARLWQKQGRRDEAREALAGIFSWFTEGFNTPDIIAARKLLDELQ
jgi:DNA-binding SARP family transcriptional activator/ABC-type transporter Mla MlaB component